MGVHSDLFPERLSYGVKGGPGYKTVVTESDSGYEFRSSSWVTDTGSFLQGQSRAQFDVAKALQTKRDIAELRDFYYSVRGGQYGFRFRDWTDWSTGPLHNELPPDDPFSAMLLGATSASNDVFQLAKSYVNSSGSYIRRITRPMRLGDDGFFLKVWATNSSGVPIGEIFPASTAFGVNIDFDAGKIRLNDPAPSPFLLAHFTFHTPCRFGAGIDQWFNVVQEDAVVHRIDSVPIVEICPDDFRDAEERLAGAFYELDLQFGNFNLDVNSYFQNGNLWKFINPGSAVTSVITLPDPTGPQIAVMPSGGPWLSLWNDDAFSGVMIRAASGAQVISLAPKNGVTLWFSTSGAGRQWVVA